jgi:PAS domain S-box-containing protein
VSDAESNIPQPPAETPPDYFRHLFDCSSFAIITTDPGGAIVSWNRVAQTLFNIDPAGMKGRPLTDIIPEHLQQRLQKIIGDVAANRGVSELEVDRIRQSGQLSFMAMVLAPIEDEGGNLIGLGAWVRDITPRKNLEKQLAQAEKLASLGTLAAGVAHHFNNILGGVATFVDFAMQSRDPNAVQRAMQMTMDAAGRVGHLTRSLLTFAEQDYQAFDMSDLTEVVLTFVHLIEDPLHKKNISVKLHMQSIPIVEVPGSRIHQVLGNLLDNSEFAMPQGGKIEVTLERRDEEVVLSFTDSGCGIAAKDLPHIFDPFFTTRGVSGGGDHPAAGMGLSVVHGIIRELGGRIEVESEVGRGAAFRIYFPIPQAPKSAPEHDDE